MRQLLLKMFDFQELATHTELERALLSPSLSCIQDNTEHFLPNAFPHLQTDLFQITAAAKLA